MKKPVERRPQKPFRRVVNVSVEQNPNQHSTRGPQPIHRHQLLATSHVPPDLVESWSHLWNLTYGLISTNIFSPELNVTQFFYNFWHLWALNYVWHFYVWLLDLLLWTVQLLFDLSLKKGDVMYANHVGALVIMRASFLCVNNRHLEKLLLKAVKPKAQFLKELNWSNTLHDICSENTLSKSIMKLTKRQLFVEARCKKASGNLNK